MNALTLENVTKQFGGKKILQGVDLAVPTGSIYGFVGENGAGKTTTLKILLGLLAPDSGSVNLFQNPVTFGQVLPEKVGYLPDVPSFYPYMRAGEYLHYAGKIAGLSREQIKTRSEAVLAQVGLTGVNKRIGNYSRGMKQRLGLAQAS
ncbi:ABC transporter ATP-binding protein [Enterococcus asini]|uniref:ABC transporter ATP-binding protein n=1 Tax=Enterococcus asini TaxID=57732 RepID=UPI00216B118C|nr:ABC transporter ATP-binding protein [Enterococcus asini]